MIVYRYSVEASFGDIMNALFENNRKRVNLRLNMCSTSYLDQHCVLKCWPSHKEDEEDQAACEIRFTKDNENGATRNRNIIELVFFYTDNVFGCKTSLMKKTAVRRKVFESIIKKLPDYQVEPWVF